MRYVFQQILTIDTTYLTKGEVWGVFCDFQLWFMFGMSDVCTIILYHIGPRHIGTRLYYVKRYLRWNISISIQIL